QSPFAKATLEIRFFHRGQIADTVYADGLQILLHHFAHARNFPHRERREKTGLSTRKNAENAVGLRLIRSDLCHQSRTRDPDRAIQTSSGFDAFVKPMRG